MGAAATTDIGLALETAVVVMLLSPTSGLMFRSALVTGFSWLRGHRFRVLMYHSVSDDSADAFAVPSRLLQEHLQTLSRAGYQCESLSSIIRSWRAGNDISHRVALTFDDGFHDFLTDALPVLQALHASATIFVPLAELGHAADWMTGGTVKRVLTRDELAEVAAAGVEVGCHGYNHVRLSMLGATRLHLEVQRSAEMMDRLAIARPWGFAYPYGAADDRARDHIKRAGFDYAVLAGGLWGNGPASDQWALTRVPVTRHLSPVGLLRMLSHRGDTDRLLQDLFIRGSSRARSPVVPRSTGEA